MRANRGPVGPPDHLLATTLVFMFLMEGWASAKDGPWTWQLTLGLVATGVLAVRNRFPAATFLVSLLAAAFAVRTGDTEQLVVVLAVLVALYTLAVRTRVRWTAAGAVVVLSLWVAQTLWLPNSPQSGAAVVGAVSVLFSVALGRMRRHSVRRADQLEQAVRLLEEAQDRLAKEAVLIERGRIARELHDIVSHGLALIAVRAGVARALMPGNPDQATEAIAVIEKVAREGLADMRHMLGALRSTDEGQPGGGEPQPGLHRLDDLVETARLSGLPVEVVRCGTPRPLQPGHELAAYRIIQEALTNVLKHAGQVRSVTTLRYLPDRLVVDVFNEAAEAVTSAPARRRRHSSLPTLSNGGQGLVGIRERVGLYGGRMSAEEVSGGFRLTAELPLQACAT